MNKKFRKLILPASIIASSQAYALGLGDLQVNSALDEELNGLIPILIDAEEDITNIQVSLASSSDYQRVGLDKDYVPTNIQVGIVENNNVKRIEVTSRGPVSEPIVSLLISVDWANGNLLREYTILLDPPLFNTAQTQQNFSDPVQTNSYTPPKTIESESQIIPDVDSNQSVNNGNNQVVVESGDTLWKIAGQVNQGYGSQQQMMVALFNNNPSAFTNNDMNRLNKGAILNVPEADVVSMVSSGEAITEVKSHLQNWSNLQTQDDSSISNSSATDIDYGIELVPPSDSDSANSNTSSGSSNDINNENRAELNRLREELTSSNLENNELSSRISELEQIIEDQDLALSLKDNNLAKLQQQIVEAAEQESNDLVSNNTDSDDVWGDSTQQLSSDETDNTDQQNVSNDEAIDDTLALANDDLSNDDTENFTDNDIVITDDVNLSESDDNVVTLQDEADDLEEVSNVTDNTQNQPSVPAEKSLIDKILDYKFEALIGLGTLIAAALAFFFVRRRKADEESEEGGFLDSISNSKESSDKDESMTESEQTEELTLEDELDLDLTEETEESDLSSENNEEHKDDENFELDQNNEDVPGVVVMDDQEDLLEDVQDDLEFHEDIEQPEDLNDEITELDESSLLLDEDSFETDDLNSDDLDEIDLSDDNEEVDLTLDVADESDDFDLDGLSLDLDDIDLNADDNDIDNDSDINEIEDLSLDDEFNLELDLDIDDDETPTKQNDPISVEEDTDELDIDEDFSLDFDTDQLEIESGNIDEEDVESALNESNDLEFNLDEETLESDDNVEFDADELNLSEYETVSIETDEPAGDVDIGLDLDDIIDDDAIDTKLDLAKAYFEMGDIDGAKQMVTEIVEEGNEDQKSKAQELMKEIDS
ncbi:MAG: FimV/HubP family polar landmark protein [Marinicellaceae bacterium]